MTLKKNELPKISKFIVKTCGEETIFSRDKEKPGYFNVYYGSKETDSVCAHCDSRYCVKNSELCSCGHAVQDQVTAEYLKEIILHKISVKRFFINSKRGNPDSVQLFLILIENDSETNSDPWVYNPNDAITDIQKIPFLI